MEKKLKEEKAKYEKEMNEMNQKMKKKIKKTREEAQMEASAAYNNLVTAKGGISTLEMIQKIKKKRKSSENAIPVIEYNVKSKYMGRFTNHKRSHSSNNSSQLQSRIGLENENSSNSNRNSEINKPRKEKPTLAVKAENAIKEADEQDEKMTPMPKIYANRQKQKRACEEKRRDMGQLIKNQNTESSQSRSLQSENDFDRTHM